MIWTAEKAANPPLGEGQYSLTKNKSHGKVKDESGFLSEEEIEEITRLIEIDIKE